LPLTFFLPKKKTACHQPPVSVAFLFLGVLYGGTIMNTLVIVLSAVLGQTEGRPSALWQESYTQAQNMAAQIKAPMAVFLTQGENGIDKLVQGGLNERARELLASNYVPVIVDTTTPAGQRLASAFGIRGEGLVLSDRGGAYQALSKPGSLTSEDLVSNLEKYADQTESRMTDNSGRASLYPTEQGSSGRLRNRRANSYTAMPVEGQRRVRLFQGWMNRRAAS
jgi:hypothetical protein